MAEFNANNILAGLVAYLVAMAAGCVVLILAQRFDIRLTKKLNEEKELRENHRAVAIDLGTTVFCQALLLRHAVFAVMAVVRTLFLGDVDPGAGGWIVMRCIGFFVGIAVISILSVLLAKRLLGAATKKLNEENEIRKGNVAVAIFQALGLLGITLILNEGMTDLARSFIAYGQNGLLP
jgi:uncharacterized membrane protein YjfL (UPF0719 family)